MVEHEDEAIHRLQASDPATGSHPDLHRLRELIAHKAPASQGADRATAVDDELLRGPRLRAPWIAAAAVVALGMGAGGYAVGAQQQDDAPGVLAEGNQHEAGAAAPGSDDSAEHGASGEAEGSGMTAADRAELETDGGAMSSDESQASMGGDSATSGPAWDPGPVRLTAGEGLPGSPGTAEVRVLQSEQTAQEFVDAWAASSGFEGEPLPDGGDNYYGPGFHGTGLIDVDEGLVIIVSDEGGSLHFNFEDIYGNEYCSHMYEGVPDEDLEMMRQDWTRNYGPSLAFPTPESCDEITGERPTDDQAKTVAGDFFTQAGVDVSAYTMSAYHDAESKMVMVDAQPTVGGGTGDLMLSATVGPDGVVNAYGTVGEMTSLGDYPVISAADAVERYGTREFSMEYGVSIAEEQVMWTEEDWEDFRMPEFTLPEPRPLEPGDKIPMLLKDKLVTSAELVRGTMWTQTAGSVEVPVWKLTTADGTYYPVLALAEEALDFQGWE